MDDAIAHNPDERGASPSERSPLETGAEPASAWLSVEQIRKRERMRRAGVIAAMESGELPYERRGRVRYARLCDVIRWEEARLRGSANAPITIRSDLEDLM